MIHRLLQEFNSQLPSSLGSALELTKVSNVNTSPKFIITTESGRYFFNSQARKLKYVEQELAYVNRLAKHGIQVPKPLSSPFQIDESWGYLSEYLEGSAPNNSVETYEDIAATMAKCHKISIAEFARPNALHDPRGFFSLSDLDLFQLQAPELDLRKLQLTLELLMVQRAVLDRQLPIALVHTDMVPSNLLSNMQTGQTFLVDFSNLRADVLLVDLCRTIYEAQTDLAKGYNEELTARLLGVYMQVRNLLPEEVQAFGLYYKFMLIDRLIYALRLLCKLPEDSQTLELVRTRLNLLNEWNRANGEN